MRPDPMYAEDSRAINLHCAARQEQGLEIEEGCARAICGQWHSGQGSAFYAFASSGHYDRARLLTELSHVIAESYASSAPATRLELDMLGTYLLNRHVGHFSHLGGTYWCDTCDSPYCELA